MPLVGVLVPVAATPPDAVAWGEAVRQLALATAQLAVVSAQLAVALLARQVSASPARTPARASAPPTATQGTPSAVQGQPTTVQGPPTGGVTRLNAATFNVLGASHTSTGGNQHPTWRSGVQRVPAMIESLRRHDVDVAGLQEFQKSQREAFRSAGTGYDMHGERDNVIVWRADRFRMVARDRVTIPYFEGRPRDMPAVQLEDRQTGRRAWFVNIHNPADTKEHPRNAANRAEAVRREREFVERLRATGLPVFLVGDFNDSSGVRTALTSGTAGMASSAPGGARVGIDQVFGAGAVRFTAHERDDSPRDDRVSDHPIVVVSAEY